MLTSTLCQLQSLYSCSVCVSRCRCSCNLSQFPARRHICSNCFSTVARTGVKLESLYDFQEFWRVERLHGFAICSTLPCPNCLQVSCEWAWKRMELRWTTVYCPLLVIWQWPCLLKSSIAVEQSKCSIFFPGMELWNTTVRSHNARSVPSASSPKCSNLVHCDLNYNKFLMLSTDKYTEWTEREWIKELVHPNI